MFRFSSRPGTGRRARPCYRPELVLLEERTLLSATITVDATHTLQSALTQANPAGGDVIQIEPSATLSTLSQTGGTVVTPTLAGTTSIIVSKFISPAEGINIGSGATADNNVLVDADTPVGSNFVLTLHTGLANAHNSAETVTPVANTIGVGVPVTIQGDPNDPAFAFPNGLTLQLFQASSSTAPVTLQNLGFSITSPGAIISGATAGDLNVNQDQFIANTDGASAIAVNVAGNETIASSHIAITGISGFGNTCQVGGNLTISGTTIRVNGVESNAESSSVTGNESVSDSTFSLLSDNCIGISSSIGGNESISHSILFGSGNSSMGNNSLVSGLLTISGSTFTMNGAGNILEASSVTGPISILGSLFNMNGDGGIVLDDSSSGGSYTVSGDRINVTGNGGSADTAIGVSSAGDFVLISSSIRMTNNAGTAVSWAPASVSPTEETILNNVISTSGLGTGLLLGQEEPAPPPVLVQGNDFQDNKIGVEVQGNGTSAGTVDLGGGALGSLGGNDFRGYPANGGRGGSFAISLAGTNTSATVSALENVWDLDANGNVIDPHLVIQDGSNNTDSTGTGVIDVGATQLSADQEYVQTLYRALLDRAGLLNQNEVNGWVSKLVVQGPLAVVQGILHDPGHEAYKHLVDSYYLTFLGRPADAGGEAAWINAFVSGATEEQVITGFLTSAEFAQTNVFLAGSNNSDAGFVQALYSVLLHRDVISGTLSPSDVQAGLTKLASLGRAGLVWDFLTGSDFTTTDGSTFRQAVVRSFYGDPTLTPLPFQLFLPNLLHRSQQVSASEVNTWAGSGMDLLSLEDSILADAEFFLRG